MCITNMCRLQEMWSGMCITNMCRVQETLRWSGMCITMCITEEVSRHSGVTTDMFDGMSGPFYSCFAVPVICCNQMHGTLQITTHLSCNILHVCI